MKPSLSAASRARFEEKMQTHLSDLTPGDMGEIMDIQSKELALALLRMGVSKGDRVTLTDIAPLGDPVAIKVNGTKLSLRKKDAASIWIAKR